ncbi:hypothetical protein ACHAXR_000102, partial [Thalassiosira sp. AJA248-18]
LDHLVQLGVLAPQNESEWASPTFIIPKKGGRWSNVNSTHYQLSTTSSENVQDRSSLLNKTSVCNTILMNLLTRKVKIYVPLPVPFGMYKYLRLPMGLKCSPDFAQAAMQNVLRGIEDSKVYIDDIGAFSQDWDSHVKLVDEILRRLRENGFTVNPLK